MIRDAVGQWAWLNYLGASARVGGYTQITPVNDGEVRCARKPAEVAVANYEDVIDDVVGKRDIAVAVVPGELGEFQDVQGRICPSTEIVLGARTLDAASCLPTQGDLASLAGASRHYGYHARDPSS